MKSVCPNCKQKSFSYWKKLWTTKINPMICKSCHATVHLKYDNWIFLIYFSVMGAIIYLTYIKIIPYDDAPYVIAGFLGALTLGEFFRALFSPLVFFYETKATIIARIILAILVLTYFVLKAYKIYIDHVAGEIPL